MLFENINFLLADRGAPSLSAKAFFELSPNDLWDIVSQLGYPFETLNTVNLAMRKELLLKKVIKLVVLDVDGVLTDGGMHYTSDGHEVKRFDVKDGMGISRAVSKGIDFGIISAALRSEVVEYRAAMLGIKHVYVGKKPKAEVLESWLYGMGLGYENVAFIGDDVNDVELLSRVGISAAPYNAIAEAKRAAHVVLTRDGGKGCVREFIDHYILYT